MVVKSSGAAAEDHLGSLCNFSGPGRARPRRIEISGRGAWGVVFLATSPAVLLCSQSREPPCRLSTRAQDTVRAQYT